MSSSVVIYRLGSLGDTVVALPCFHRIAASFPDSRRLVLTNIPVSANVAPLESILRPAELIHGSISYPLRTREPREVLRLTRELRDVGADTLIYLGGGRGRLRVLRDVLWFRACGFSRIIGAPLKADLEHGRIDADGYEEPEAERLARCIVELGPIDLESRAAWDLDLTSQEISEGERFISGLQGRRFIAVNTGGKVKQKDWGEDNWIQLLTDIGQRANLGLLILGGNEDRSRAQTLMKAWRGPALDACGQLSARGSAAALRRAEFFLGHDSGPLHLAAAMGVRCVGLFGDYNRPRRWHPYGQGHVVLHDMRGVRAIMPNQVAAALAARGFLT